MPTQSKDKIIIANLILIGGSGGLSPESFWKKTNHGNLIPAWRKTPADAAANESHITNKCWSAAAWEIIDLVTNPLNRGKAEIDAPPMIQNPVVHGIVL